MFRLALAPLAVLALTAPLAAQATAAVEADAALLRALDTISAEEISSDLYFMASDEMGGRDSPSPQQRIAARFIRARLQRLGFEPGAPEDRYLYDWSTPQVGLDRTRTWMEVHSGDDVARLEWGSDYFPTWRSAGMREVEGGVIYVGEIDSSVLQLEGLSGKWILGESTRGIGRDLSGKLQKAGVVGVLVLPKEGAQQTVAESLSQIVKRYDGKSLSRRNNSAGYPILYLGEASGAGMRAALPADAGAGTALEMTVKESCGYGNIGDAHLENVVGLWPGSDPELSKELIILSAHYDHVGTTNGQIYNGADDNGSGTCGMLALAEALSEYGPMRRTVMLMWVSAEEKGLMGSYAWTMDPYLPDGLKPICNINIDMIGRNAPDELAITPTKKREEYSALTKVAEANAASEGFGPLKSADAYWGRSDHANFSRNMKIPVAFLFADVHEDYHKPTDTPDKIDYDKMRRVVRLVVRMLHDLQADQIEF